MLDNAIKQYISKSVLCWLATCDRNGIPNVSPKELFTYQGDQFLLIANIASPGSVKNILENPQVCVSFIDVFLQKVYKLKGRARIVEKDAPDFSSKLKPLTGLFTDKSPFSLLLKLR
jgi:predicted pyridoxine 5'-phosphate oxidase superfamily flavin-nucleotide-binding protein